jgi:hypothetical protein
LVLIRVDEVVIGGGRRAAGSKRGRKLGAVAGRVLVEQGDRGGQTGNLLRLAENLAGGVVGVAVARRGRVGQVVVRCRL